MKVYFQVLGPNEKHNLLFIEKVCNRRFSMLNDFRMTVEMQLDKDAFMSYLILTEDTDFAEKQKWMEYYYNNNTMQLITEIT